MEEHIVVTDIDDPSIQLLGHTHHVRAQWSYSDCIHKGFHSICSVTSWKRRLPLLKWLPNYSLNFLLQDAIAGLTVGLTSIPQGIAYAIIAGLPPQWGLYSSMFPGFVYMVFGSCKDVTVGPTAILAVLVSKYVAYSVDFAVLAGFLSGCFILLLGVLHLGFLLDFISKPVISGFTTAAALQIAASQLKSLFRVAGSSGGGTFVMALVHFFKNIKSVQLADTLLGFATIILLIFIKKLLALLATASCRPCVLYSLQLLGRARNAIVVAFGATLAFCLREYASLQPFALTGKIEGGLPPFSLPPFSTVVNNQTYNFEDMMEVFNAEGLVMPLVAILESIAIAKAFAGSASVDASQEMIAVGMCNVVTSFWPSMPVTGSFTRTAINHDSGVVTPAGGVFKGLLVLLSVSFLAPAFSWIPRTTLAAVIIMAMFSILTVKIIPLLWTHSKLELLVFSATVVTGASAGLEYGILCGALTDLLRLLYIAARPKILVDTFKVRNQHCILMLLQGNLSYCCAEYFNDKIRKYMTGQNYFLILDGRHLHSIDIGVAENLISVVLDLEQKDHKILLWHFAPHLQKLLEDIHPTFVGHFTNASNMDDHLLDVITS